MVAEHYKSGLDVETHANEIKKIANEIGWRKDFNGRLNALIDSAANQKTLAYSKSVAELFYDNGINVNANVNKDLFSGINRVKSYLKSNRIFIFKNCVNLIRELKGYRWGKDDCPIKRDDHALDELRYYLMTKPHIDKPVKILNDVQKDKQRLIRKISKSNKGGKFYG